MTQTARRHADDLRAAGQLVGAASLSVLGAVEEMHQVIARRPVAVYRAIRWIARRVGLGIDGALALLAPALGEGPAGPRRDAVVSALNGVLGDHLDEIGSPLAIQMGFRQGRRPLSRDGQVSGKLLVLVHGSSMSDRQWSRAGHDHGQALARDLGHSAIYLHYNSGLHVSTNGRTLARLLEELVRGWPVPVEEISLVGHSMGGLVARSACHVGSREDRLWRRRLRKLVCLGTPHHGSPLERGGNWLHALLAVSAYSAPIARLARIRSAGVTDMRFGHVVDEDWKGQD